LFVLISLLAPYALAQHNHSTAASKHMTKMTDAEKIADAMSAAPAEVSKDATIMDWGATMADPPRQLRAGTNGWVCFPNSPAEYGEASVRDPMCLDAQWQQWAEAWMSKTQPKPKGPGIAYMLKGDKGASNTDPFATGPTADNHWVIAPSHIMVLYPDTSMLDAFPTDPMQGGAWVMWKGTPYAHLMVPVSSTSKAKMPTIK
jgi:hypothetical protein